MGRPNRAADGGLVYHVLNRSNAKLPIFKKEADYQAFKRVLEEAVERSATRLLAYCVLRTHGHLVVWLREDGELSRFTGWLTFWSGEPPSPPRSTPKTNKRFLTVPQRVRPSVVSRRHD